MVHAGTGKIDTNLKVCLLYTSESLHKAEQMQDLIYKRYTGNIRFAYTRPMSPNYIPNLIRGFFFKNENKKINIESYSAATAVIINDLKNDKIDFGFCSDSEVQDDEIKLIRLIDVYKRQSVHSTSTSISDALNK